MRRGVSGRARRRTDSNVHGLGVADFEEVDTLRLQLDHLALREASSPNSNRVSLVEAKLVHDLGGGRGLSVVEGSLDRAMQLTHCGRLTVPS